MDDILDGNWQEFDLAIERAYILFKAIGREPITTGSLRQDIEDTYRDLVLSASENVKKEGDSERHSTWMLYADVSKEDGHTVIGLGINVATIWERE